MKEKNKKKKNEYGFMMAEAIISVAIISIALVTFMTVLGKTYIVEINKRDHTIASSLTQEGIEIIRNIRDNNWKEGDGAFDNANGTSIFPASGSHCFDYRDNASKGSGSSCGNLKRDNNGLYNYSSGADTKFKRTITIAGAGSSGRTINSRVTWRPRGASSDIFIEMEETLYSWGDR